MTKGITSSITSIESNYNDIAYVLIEIDPDGDTIKEHSFPGIEFIFLPDPDIFDEDSVFNNDS